MNEGQKRLFVAIFSIGVLAMIGLHFFSNNYFALTRGESMLPTFTGCTLLLVDSSFSPEALKPGDVTIVDISSEDAPFESVSHRVVENFVSEEVFSTRGDNSSIYDFPSSIDGFFEYNDFEGKVDYFVNLPEQLCGGEN